MKYEIKERAWIKEMLADKELCGNCAYFHFHYLLIEDAARGAPYIEKAHFGHCSECRIKRREIYKTCDKFKRKEG